MNEKRLYKLAREMLLLKWCREHNFLEEHPNDKISIIKEKKLWDELNELEKEMKERKLV